LKLINGMYDVHMACRMPYTINISIIHILILYFFVLNKFSAILDLKKTMAALRPVKKNMWPSEKKDAHLLKGYIVLESILYIQTC